MTFNSVGDTVIVGVIIKVVWHIRCVGIYDCDCAATIVRVIGIVDPVAIGVASAGWCVAALGLSLHVVHDAITVGIGIQRIGNAVAVNIAVSFDGIRNTVAIVVGVSGIVYTIPVRIDCRYAHTDTRACRDVVRGVGGRIDLRELDMTPHAIIVATVGHTRVGHVIGKDCRPTSGHDERA